ncbi:glycoside hydrolase family 32 protein [Bacillus marinisedimentorum]|uniref:glycoside hydrolase family 32 protein n=1 Tax=Bacillus marinisedimentorum TaxID=1821260 RepID=UPI0007E1F94A|nr:glycoside hydrolase family 32 protein [Bacillus marinisedimentorum]
MKNHEELLEKAQQSVQKGKETAEKSYWKPLYHITPPAYWMNDPNGFSFFNGEYHLFYQHHPYSAEWGPMHWGHAKSKDLAVWEHLPIALAPSEEYDRDGCFSGSAIEKDGKLFLMYTGHKWTGDNPDIDLEQVQCLAVSRDGIHFEKIAGNPVIEAAPVGDVHPDHFRDPKVWEHDGTYYCVIGSKTKNDAGQVLLYRSADLENWEFVNIPAKGAGNAGFMWECPDLFNLGGHDVLVLSPQGVKPEGYLYQNVHQAGYRVGELDYETGVFEHGDFQLLDYGFDFYAPQTMTDDEGRRIMIAWMTMWENDLPEQEFGWAGAMTVPRELSIEDGRMYSRPVPELQTLRGNEVAYQQVTIDGEKELEGIAGDCYELELAVDMTQSAAFTLKLRTDTAGTEETILSFDKEEGFLTFDRTKSGQGPRGIRKAPVELEKGKLHLHVFVDRSSIEVFINNGEKVMTGRIYPKESSTGLRMSAEGTAMVDSLRKWELKQAIS